MHASHSNTNPGNTNPGNTNPGNASRSSAGRGNATLIATAVLAALAVVILAAALVTAPMVHGADDGPASVADQESLVVGVKDDQPGLSLRAGGGGLEGFDIAVATYIAGQLRISPDKLTFRPLTSGEREDALENGDVDMIVATYSITPERKERVTFAGPYYVAHQDILVRHGERSIKEVRDLRGKRLCQVSGSNSWRRVTEQLGIAARLVRARSYSECVDMLAGGRLDAVSTDDLILAGFAGATGSGATMLNAPFTDERYGIGLRKGDVKGCRAVNRILTGMYQNGAAETLLGQWFGASGLDVTTTVPQFEGCT